MIRKVGEPMRKYFGVIGVAALVLLAGCVQRSEGSAQMSDGADIVVTGEGPVAPIESGASAAFHIKIANAGPNDAADVRIVDTIGSQAKLVSMQCTAAAGAVCPDPLNVSMTVPKIPNGGVLNLTVTLKLADLPTGTIVNSLVATFDKDGDPNNNSVATDVNVR